MENLIIIAMGALVGHVAGFAGKKQMYKTYLALAFFIMCGAVFVNEVIPVAREPFYVNGDICCYNSTIRASS